MNRTYKTKEEIIKRAEEILGFTLRKVINNDTVSEEIEYKLKEQRNTIILYLLQIEVKNMLI